MAPYHAEARVDDMAAFRASQSSRKARVHSHQAEPTDIAASSHWTTSPVLGRLRKTDKHNSQGRSSCRGIITVGDEGKRCSVKISKLELFSPATWDSPLRKAALSALFLATGAKF